ncbi:MAG TPA: BlaI/MecI/CopY family transcriptional regulator [Hyphomonadaceae bacterium]|jgi:predicted transcriptional regulator
MPSKDVSLSDMQLALMRVLWGAGRATTAEVHERVGKPRQLAYTTVATLLTRLEKRGLVKSVKEQGERVFKPTVTESEVTRSMVSSLVDTLFRGDPSALVSHLVNEKDIDRDDIEAVRKLLARRGKTG